MSHSSKLIHLFEYFYSFIEKKKKKKIFCIILAQALEEHRRQQRSIFYEHAEIIKKKNDVQLKIFKKKIFICDVRVIAYM